MKYCRLVYFAFFALWIIWAAVLYTTLGEMMHRASWLQWVPLIKSITVFEAPYYIASTVGSMLFFFHLIMALLTSCAEGSSPGPFKAIHRKLMPVKLLIQFVVWFLFMMIPKGFYKFMHYVYLVCSVFYVIAQVVTTLETGYRFNNKATRKNNFIPILVFTIILYLLAVTLIIFEFYFFTVKSMLAPCLGLMITIVVLCIIFLILSIVEESGSILPSAFVTIVLALHAGYALVAYAHDGTNMLGPNGVLSRSLDYIAFEDTLMSFEVILLAVTSFFGAVSIISISALFGKADTDYGEYEGYDSSGDEVKDAAPSYAYYGFHIVCMFAAAMFSTIFMDVTRPLWAFYVLAVGSGLGAILYIWTIIAPRLFPDRSFGN